MRRLIAVCLLLSFVFSACSSAQPPAATLAATEAPLNPTSTPLSPTAAPNQQPLYEIPSVAWQRGIGMPYDTPGKAKTNYGIIDDGTWNGLPLGGLGAGAIGRSYRGDFSRWHLDLGTHSYESLPANQFSVYISQNGQNQAHVLAPLKPSGALASWNWDMPAGAGTYYALFPKAWFVYDWDTLPVRLAQMQFSPVIPNNYQESSYPVAVFEWKLNNPTDQPMTVSLMFSWQNLVGHQWGRDGMGGNYNMAVDLDGLTGVVLTHKGDQVSEEWDGSFAMLTSQANGVTVTYRSRVPMIDAGSLWQDFSTDGQLDNLDDEKISNGEVLLAGLSASVELQPGETRTIPFVLAWDFPITEFGNGTQWFKRYTAFYGVTGRNAWQIAADAIQAYPDWETQIDAWQQPILAETGSPDWYKTALFNELYYLVDGGTVWENGRVDGKAEPALAPGATQGHFAFLECFDYLYYNTFDVNFYSSFSMIHLWPELETGMLRDFAAAVQVSDPRTVIIGSTNEPATRKIAGAVPHDLGGPNEDPWRQVNAYNWTDINIWRDLNSKFVLQIWRDYIYTGDTALVQDLWPAAVQALDYLHAFDLDGSGLPDHVGLPDQTYDTWSLTGDSAYGGGLWLAALEAAIKMGTMVGDEANVARYREWLEKGKISYEKLWTGSYYLLDAGNSATSNSIMADQLAGQWYADATGLPAIVPEEHIITALKTIYQNNVLKFQDGQMGAVNGMRPDGTLDTSGEQSQEVWSGTSYALTAFMLGRGLTEEAWGTAWGVYNVTYNRGYWFRTPEAWDKNGNFRASMYMRPLSIWATRPRPEVTVQSASLPANPAILLPEPGQVLSGAFLPQAGGYQTAAREKLDAFAADTGKYPAIELMFYDWSADTWTKAKKQIDIIEPLGGYVMVGWEPRVFTQKMVLQAIIDGDEDATIRKFAEGAKAYGKPVFLRWGHEMNGDWYPWSGDDNNKNPDLYVQAWRHIHDVMVKEVGATNIIWVWCPNAYSVPNVAWNSLDKYYPGDEYVDWVALDFYGLMNGWGRNDPGPALDQVYKLYGDRKPVMIGESAAADPAHSDAAYGMSKAEWINLWFDAIEARPNVRAAVWFNIDKEANWTVQSDAEALAAYRARLSAAGYLGQPYQK